MANVDTTLGLGKEIWAFQGGYSFSAFYYSVSLSAGMEQCHCLVYKFESPAGVRSALLTNQICFSTTVSVHTHGASQTKDRSKHTILLSLLECLGMRLSKCMPNHWFHWHECDKSSMQKIWKCNSTMHNIRKHTPSSLMLGYASARGVVALLTLCVCVSAFYKLLTRFILDIWVGFDLSTLCKLLINSAAAFLSVQL